MAKHGAWMPLYWSDYFGKTSHLTTEEHGAYLLLIGAYWQRGKPLPDDDQFLSAATRLSRKRWRIMRQKISEYFSLVDGAWRHERIEKEILNSCNRIAAASANANARWHAEPMLPTPTPTPIQEESKKKEDLKLILGGLGKNGNGAFSLDHTTIKDPTKRIVIFQQKLLPYLGQDGHSVIDRAMHPEHPDYETCLNLCKCAAKRAGKGWPHNWPQQKL